MTCASCGTENKPGRKFCSACGATLAVGCPSCGAANEPGDAFCGECGSPLRRAGTLRAAARRGARGRAQARLGPLRRSRRLHALSEERDAEDTRELLSRYFDTCRRLIELYGGTVEKFIGDAVMAVWGTPAATEDDAERAVRAALDLVAAVSALGDEVGVPDLRARAGVLTGEAAVTIGAEGEGMVAGDLVNTASRVQALAEPGTVLVGEATRRATEQTIAYEDAGSHELKGKVGLTPFWRALRVVSGARGTLKSVGLEAPFVGRDRELRQIKELFHARADEGKAHLDLDHRRSPGSASRGSAGSSTSTSTGSSRRRTGTAAVVSPTARASPTGRSRTWCGCARGSSRTRSRAPRSPSSARSSRSTSPTPEERRFVEPRLRAPARARRGERRLRAGGPLRRLAAVLRAARRSSTRW